MSEEGMRDALQVYHQQLVKFLDPSDICDFFLVYGEIDISTYEDWINKSTLKRERVLLLLDFIKNGIPRRFQILWAYLQEKGRTDIMERLQSAVDKNRDSGGNI